MKSELIDTIRAFNREYTKAMGLLSRDFLGTGRPLSELRMLFDIGAERSGTLREMAARLDIDEGYASRLIDGFERLGWVTKTTDAKDKRRRVLELTDLGTKEVDALVTLQRNDISERLNRLGLSGEAVANAASRFLATIKPIEPADVQLRHLSTGDIGWLSSRHAEAYAESDNYDLSFEILVTEILVEYVKSNDPACERAWIAEAHGRRLGSVFCVKSGTEGVAKLRLFYLEPEARGLGLGRRMLDELLTFAVESGYTKVALWTHEAHKAACRLYAARGFRCISEKPAHSFGVDVIEQHWELALD